MTNTKQRILIVDDDVRVAAALGRVLRQAGFAIEIVNDGLSAGALIPVFQPHLITLDITMPGLGGEEVLRYLRGVPAFDQVRILVVSANEPDRMPADCAKLYDGYLEKPFENEELVAAVEGLLAHGRC